MFKNIFLTCLVPFLFLGCLSSTTSAGAVDASRTQLLLISSDTMNNSAIQEYSKVISEARAKNTLNQDSKTAAKVKEIAKKLISQVGVFRQDALKWDWEVNVITSDTVNAWCMPGGKIAVYTGIIEKLHLNDDELAAVMGHEIAHALREHSREQASQDQIKNIGIWATSQFLGLGDLGTAALNLATQYTISLPFSRSHETEADKIGTELMARAGYNPKYAVSVWEKMKKFSDSQTPEILSTHPSHDTRIKDLSEISKKVMYLYEESK